MKVKVKTYTQHPAQRVKLATAKKALITIAAIFSFGQDNKELSISTAVSKTLFLPRTKTINFTVNISPLDFTEFGDHFLCENLTKIHYTVSLNKLRRLS